MQVAITDFKARCTEYVRNLRNMGQDIEITNRGKVVAIVSPPRDKAKKNPVFGALKSTVTYISDDFDQPLGDEEWEAGDSEVSP